MNSISLRGVTGRDEPIRQRFEENDQISDFLIRENRGGTAPSKRRIDIDIVPVLGREIVKFQYHSGAVPRIPFFWI